MAKSNKAKTKEKELSVKIRQLTIDDFDAVVTMQLAAFPEMKPWKKEQWEQTVTTFPEGQMGVLLNDVLVASSSSILLNFDEFSINHSWAEITGNGTMSTHNPLGDTLYSIEIMVDPAYRNMKLARRLYEARKKLAREMNLKRIVLGGRLPNYHTVADKMNIREYVQHVMDKKLFDPVLTTQLSNGFVLKRIIKDYLPGDAESCGYATFMEWVNLDYQAEGEQVLNPYVRVCAVQYRMRLVNSFDEFARYCEYFIDVAADYKSDFVLFPEMITMQLLSFLPNQRPGQAVRQLADFTGQYIDFFREMAIRYNTNIIAGSHFSVEDDNELYNISFLFRRDGSFDKQYKLHITPHEKKWWGVKPGEKVAVFDTDCGKIAISICYDIEFPELARIATSKGAQIIFVPFNTDDRRSYNRVRYCAQARAIENQIYVVLAGCVGNLPQVDNLDIQYAQSAILTPSDVEFHRDAIAAEAEAGDETLIYQDLDMQLLKRNRVAGSVRTWLDRRNDLYRILYFEDDQEKIL
ncbi:GNAT family N-acetyltransferase [Pseudoflavitalea sp. G-6-1-2]|uniref:bifunctional GNAT family N-acetyltransferase/carbon-nitrogen hydrolase family protein n=1 Tax=Pseudoflavitalea sp. G-6-1-2 TaxID=2728841 RepID=UPI00146AD761|nr:bifunctional GNAT family N-acetyltransferase/carbon-nitrogen hydrolase family protein [Pseudoflavitalea sp. G-6-1-2]NML21809.1 GNAT family N-acetyltransferase [Pseudoflavitalea sp. G-6-1-2]